MTEAIQLLRAVAELAVALKWAAVVIIVIVVLYRYRAAVRGILENVEHITLPCGFAAKIRREAQRTAEIAPQAQTTPDELSEREVEAAERLGVAALDHDASIVRRIAGQFAREYERTRAALPGGEERTRLMQAVVTKLRTLAVAARPFLPELAESKSCGERLAAVVILQVRPDAGWVEWLGQIAAEDMTFVGHQATVALLIAARTLRTREAKTRVMEAASLVRSALAAETRNHHRAKVLDRVEAELGTNE